MPNIVLQDPSGKLKERLDAYAAKKGWPKSTILRAAIDDYLTAKENPQPPITTQSQELKPDWPFQRSHYFEKV